MAVNNGSAEPGYYVDRLHQHRVQVQQQHCQQAARFSVHTSHVPAAGKEILESPRRDDLVYVHCATTEDEDAEEEEEEEEPKALTRSRSWLCCPGDRSSDRTVPIQIETSYRDKQRESVSGEDDPTRTTWFKRLLNRNFIRTSLRSNSQSMLTSE